LPGFLTLKIVVVCSPKMLDSLNISQHYNPEDHIQYYFFLECICYIGKEKLWRILDMLFLSIGVLQFPHHVIQMSGDLLSSESLRALALVSNRSFLSHLIEFTNSLFRKYI
jgi:hypothetical protein